MSDELAKLQTSFKLESVAFSWHFLGRRMTSIIQQVLSDVGISRPVESLSN